MLSHWSIHRHLLKCLLPSLEFKSIMQWYIQWHEWYRRIPFNWFTEGDSFWNHESSILTQVGWVPWSPQISWLKMSNCYNTSLWWGMHNGLRSLLVSLSESTTLDFPNLMWVNQPSPMDLPAREVWIWTFFLDWLIIWSCSCRVGSGPYCSVWLTKYYWIIYK